MSFYRKYELLELVEPGKPRVFTGREIATGRAVEVHLFPATPSAEMETLLARTRDKTAGRDGARGRLEGAASIRGGRSASPAAAGRARAAFAGRAGRVHPNVSVAGCGRAACPASVSSAASPRRSGCAAAGRLGRAHV